MAMAQSGASATEMGLPWRQYPTKAELVPQAMVFLIWIDLSIDELNLFSGFFCFLFT
jgi:hypothetical protein